MKEINKIEIWTPRWKDRMVLVADWKLGVHNEITITAKRKDGTRFFPNSLYISGDKARTFPIQQHPGTGASMRVIPLSELNPSPELSKLEV